MTKKKSKIIIRGVTSEGKTFRPSDWAERMSGTLANTKNQRVIYSPLLRPSVHDGSKCVLLDKKLQESNPHLYHHMLEFAKSNDLQICEEEDAPES